MRHYISLLLFGLLALAVASCDTDELKRDIDALKDRVESYETQMQQLNDEMNIIRVLLDGNKTITDYSKEGDTYTLTLSNGETLTLTPGVVGGNYPSIEIGENGNWVIAGKDTGLRTKAEDGVDATITPQFKVEANPADEGKKYWYVSYNEGATWAVLENGLVEGANTATSAIQKAEIVGNNLEITLSDGAKHQLPIVKGLVCAINKPDGLVDGMWAVAGGGESSFTVKVSLTEGDLVRVKAPADWKTKLSGNVAGSTEVTVTVTPPTTPSQCIITVEVTHGVNTATDYLKARIASDSYYADYNAGFDIQIGDLVINRYDDKGGQLVSDGGAISANGIYFIADGATVNWTGGSSNLIVLPEKRNSFPTLNVAVSGANGYITLGSNGESTYGVLLKGIKLVGNTLNYSFNARNTTKRVVFEHCEIEMIKDKSLTFLSSAGAIGDIVVESCRIKIPAATNSAAALSFWNLSTATTFNNVKICNNIFYCADVNKTTPVTVTLGHKDIINNTITIENNTFINIHNNIGGSSGYAKTPMQEGRTFKNNLIWYDTEWTNTPIATSNLASLVALPLAGFNMDNIAGNEVFTGVTDTKLVWSYFRGAMPEGMANPRIFPSTDSPFVEGSLNATEGKYQLKPQYQGIGATID